jgi:hypothetical protein
MILKGLLLRLIESFSRGIVIFKLDTFRDVSQHKKTKKSAMSSAENQVNKQPVQQFWT